MIDPDFDVAVRGAGGELDASTSQNPAQRFTLEYIRNVLRAMGQSQLYFGLVRNRFFNARAFRYNERRFIGLHSGAVRALQHSSWALLSHRRVLPSIGSPSREIGEHEFRSGFQHLTHSAMPRCPDRQLFARALFQFAGALIFCHEHGHHWAGHVEYVTRLDPKFYLCESHEDAPSLGLDAYTMQAIELDADRAAVSMYVGSFVDLCDAFPDHNQALRAWFTAMFLVFYLMGEATGSLADVSGSTHPHPSVRMMFSIPHACQEISRRMPHLSRNVGEIATSSLMEIQASWSAIRAPGSENLERAVSENGRRVLFALHRELSRLQSRNISKCVYPEPDEADI